MLGFTAILCIALGAGACGALNQWYEVDLDAKMRRTAKRPLPAGRMERQSALHFGVGLGGFSVLLMGLATNWFAAALLAASILFYVMIYTVWLKPRTAQNIVIGGAAGAFPPLIGWVAATGHVAALPLLLFAIIFLWTPRISGRCPCSCAPIMPPPAFRCCRWSRASETPGARSSSTRLPMAAAAVAPWPLGLTGAVYGVSAAVLSFVFLVLAARVAANRATEPAGMGAEKHLFAYSVFYLFALFAVLVADRWLAMVSAEDEIIRKRQRDRARITALLLGAFVVLLFFITIAKTGMNW